MRLRVLLHIHLDVDTATRNGGRSGDPGSNTISRTSRNGRGAWSSTTWDLQISCARNGNALGTVALADRERLVVIIIHFRRGRFLVSRTIGRHPAWRIIHLDDIGGGVTRISVGIACATTAGGLTLSGRAKTGAAGWRIARIRNGHTRVRVARDTRTTARTCGPKTRGHGRSGYFNRALWHVVPFALRSGVLLNGRCPTR